MMLYYEYDVFFIFITEKNNIYTYIYIYIFVFNGNILVVPGDASV